VRISREARRDLVNIYADSLDRFGEEARARYERLIRAALRDLAENPNRAGVRELDGIAPKLYHLRHSRKRAEQAGRVRAPRHYIAFHADAQRIEIVRILYDTMDLESQLTDEE
jgi:toxin ParE1/3/4